METEEEADQESPNCEESEIDDSEHSSTSDTESSDLDEDTIDNRKSEYISEGQELEQAFQLVKNLLYEEKMKMIECKLGMLKDGTAPEYLQPIEQLNAKLERKLNVSLIRKDLRLELIKVQFESESLAAHQNVENDKRQLFDTVKSELEEKIRRLEEDRQNIDISSDLWESQSLKRSRVRRGAKPIGKERRKKPVVVSSPYIIYMLEDGDILEDWTHIKKALKQKQQQQKRSRPSSTFSHSTMSKDKFLARFQDGRLYYQGEQYCNGHFIVIDNKQDSPVHASITALNPTEIWVRKSDGNKSKLYITQLQKGKYTIKHASRFR